MGTPLQQEGKEARPSWQVEGGASRHAAAVAAGCPLVDCGRDGAPPVHAPGGEGRHPARREDLQLPDRSACGGQRKGPDDRVILLAMPEKNQDDRIQGRAWSCVGVHELPYLDGKKSCN